MGLFDRMFGNSTPPSDLQKQLFDAVAAGDRKLLVQLCRANEKAILELLPSWKTVPLETRADPRALQWYGQGLMTVVVLFANELGHPEVLAAFTGDQASNPIVQLGKKLELARSLMGELRYEEAISLLTDEMIEARTLSGSGIDNFLAASFASLGECWLQLGKAEKALAPTRNALELCQKWGDAQGVRAYLGNLYEIHRYLGQGQAAGEAAERLADVSAATDAPGAARWRRRAAIARAGEPLNRVVGELDTGQVELDELAIPRSGTVRFAFARNRISLQPSVVHTQRGERLGARGKFEEALEAFEEARTADRFDPHPPYQAGVTLALLRRHGEAAEHHELADELAPGWFGCRASAWLSAAIAAGRLEHETFAAIRTLEDGRETPAQKLRVADDALRAAPEVAWLHDLRARTLQALGRTADMEAALRAGLACAQEPDVRTRLLTSLGLVTARPDERVRLLEEAVSLSGHLVSAAMARLALGARGA